MIWLSRDDREKIIRMLRLGADNKEVCARFEDDDVDAIARGCDYARRTIDALAEGLDRTISAAPTDAEREQRDLEDLADLVPVGRHGWDIPT